jgi:hypothetical protein
VWLKLRAVVETEDALHDGGEVGWDTDRPCPASILAARVLVAVKLDGEGLTEIGDRPGELDRAPPRIDLANRQVVFMGEGLDARNVLRVRAMSRLELFVRQAGSGRELLLWAKEDRDLDLLGRISGPDSCRPLEGLSVTPGKWEVGFRLLRHGSLLAAKPTAERGGCAR